MSAYEMLERGLVTPDKKLLSCSDCGYIGERCSKCLGAEEKLMICDGCGEIVVVDANYNLPKCPSCSDVDPYETVRVPTKKIREPTEERGDNSLFYWKTVLPTVLRSSIARV